MTAARQPDPPVPARAADRSGDHERFSSFIDGECQPAEADDVCKRWRSDAELRKTWHAYHLIGDVLRSDELAGGVRRDAAFLEGVRARLAAEPVPLAPAPLVQRDLRPRRWLAPVAAAAGFVVVGITVVAMRPVVSDAPTGWGSPMAVTQPADAGVTRRVNSAAVPASGQQILLLDGQLIRDARLDAYFEAHRGAVGPVPSAVPGGALRSVEILVPQR